MFQMFAPNLKILVPVRDFDLTRLEEEALCRWMGSSRTEMITGGDDKPCGADQSPVVRSDLNQPLPDDIWMWYWPIERAPDEPSCCYPRIWKGDSNQIDESESRLERSFLCSIHLAECIPLVRSTCLKDGIMDLEEPEIYEAPGATIILRLHRDLEAVLPHQRWDSG